LPSWEPCSPEGSYEQEGEKAARRSRRKKDSKGLRKAQALEGKGCERRKNNKRNDAGIKRKKRKLKRTDAGGGSGDTQYSRFFGDRAHLLGNFAGSARF
jgi:hypothetical protein